MAAAKEEVKKVKLEPILVENEEERGEERKGDNVIIRDEEDEGEEEEEEEEEEDREGEGEG